MSKLPFGGFEADPINENVEGWEKLTDIVKDLEAGKAVNPYLAYWLANAITRSDRNPDELLRLLELKKRRGRQRTKFTQKQSRDFGAKVCALEDEGVRPEAALSAVLETIDPQPERSQLQKWRDEYRSMLIEARLVDLEEDATK